MEICAPVAGVLTWLPLTTDDARASEIERTCLWPTRVPCVEATPSRRTAPSATAAGPRLIRGTEFDVWYGYPRHGHLSPWGLIARRVPAELAQWWHENAAARLSFQPRGREMASSNRGAETGKAPLRAQEQLRLLAKSKHQPDKPVVRVVRRPK